MYDLTFGQNGHFIQNNQPKNPCVFISHVFSQNRHSFGQCGHFNQVEPFEKPWFFIVYIKDPNIEKNLCTWIQWVPTKVPCYI